MNILSISSILPIPGFSKANDCVFQTYINYNKIYNSDNIVFINPVRIVLNPIKILRKQTLLSRLKRQFSGEAYGFKIFILPFFSAWGYRNIHALITRSIYDMNIHKIDTLLNQYKFDVIHAQYILPDGLLAYILSKKLGIPYLVTSHNERYYFEHAISGKIVHKIFRNASKITPINYTNYLYYRSLGVKNLFPTPLGFNRNFLRDQKPSSTGKIKILTIAELIKLKNIDKVLKAIKSLVNKYDIHYTIIGQGPERENLMRLTESMNLNFHVDFLSRIPHDQIGTEMYKHDIFIMPSFFETFGRVYFEVMAMGIPIICAKGSGIYGIFKEMEEGISVDHNDVKSIINALEYLIKNPDERLRIGSNGKRLVENYTWENIATDLHEKYIEIVRAKE